MGYRSEVAIRIEKAKPVLLAYQLEYPTEWNELMEEFSEDIEVDDDTWTFHINDVKWYDSYHHVKLMMAFWDYMDKKEYQFNVNAAYVEIGEDTDDIKHMVINDGWDLIDITRSIEL